MALVSYDVSDASDEEEESEVPAEGVIEVKASTSAAEEKVYRKPDEELIEKYDSVISSALPTPKTKPLLFNSDLSERLLLNKKSNATTKKSVKITIPSLSEFEEDLPTPTTKKIVPSSKGSGLFALLPPPKNSAMVAKDKNLIPDSLRKRPPPKPVKPLPKPVIAPVVEEPPGDDEDVDGDTDFLGLNRSPEPEPVAITIPDLPELPPLLPPKESVEVLENRLDAANYPPTSEFLPIDSDDLSLDDEAMQKLCGGNKRRRTNVQAQLIDVSESDVVPDKSEWMVKQLTEEKVRTQSHRKNSGPSSQQRRKHQITYLAFQAKEQELELQNQWAHNRMTKKQTQSKYGF